MQWEGKLDLETPSAMMYQHGLGIIKFFLSKKKICLMQSIH